MQYTRPVFSGPRTTAPEYYPPNRMLKPQIQETTISESDEYNFVGLTKVFSQNMPDADKESKSLTLGIDLMELGLNLHANETENLYNSQI